jgi:serine phosphatase RsbU (regulator of sigma subunit)
VTPLRDGSIALGMMPKLPFLKSGEVDLPPESTLLCYTDGLVEQEDASGTAFETAPINGILSAGARATAKAINEAVINAFEAHRGGLPYLDDIALLTCRFA